MDYSRYEHIRVERRDRVLCLTLSRPERLNAVNPAMHRELATIFSDVSSDEKADVVTITGAGRAFCAGADLKEPVPDAATGERIFTEARQILVAILEMEKPLVSGINGAATGLGATLALLPDIVIASESARIGDTHVKVGLAAGDGGCVIWPLLVGVNKAKEMLMTGRILSASQAMDLGLVNRVVPAESLEQEMMATARELASGHLPAIRATKKALNMYIKWMLNQVGEYALELEHQCAKDLFRQFGS